MKSFYIYIAVMAVVMCVYSVVLLTMAKKRKRDVQEWLVNCTHNLGHKIGGAVFCE